MNTLFLLNYSRAPRDCQLQSSLFYTSRMPSLPAFTLTSRHTTAIVRSIRRCGEEARWEAEIFGG